MDAFYYLTVAVIGLIIFMISYTNCRNTTSKTRVVSYLSAVLGFSLIIITFIQYSESPKNQDIKKEQGVIREDLFDNISFIPSMHKLSGSIAESPEQKRFGEEDTVSFQLRLESEVFNINSMLANDYFKVNFYKIETDWNGNSIIRKIGVINRKENIYYTNLVMRKEDINVHYEVLLNHLLLETELTATYDPVWRAIVK